MDASLTNQLAGTSIHAPAFVPGRVLGGAQFQFGAAAATYGVGRLTGDARVARVGAQLLRAQLLAQATTQAIKFSVKRTRPDGTTRNSFPSGHASVSFASATVLGREFGWKVGVPAYAVASYIGLSRIEHKRHYLSDVLFGAAIGMMAGRSVGLTIGDRRFDMSPVAAPGGAGVMFVWDGR
jgi:membrane-associated phospholipid phosphatase